MLSTLLPPEYDYCMEKYENRRIPTSRAWNVASSCRVRCPRYVACIRIAACSCALLSSSPICSRCPSSSSCLACSVLPLGPQCREALA